MAVLKGVGLLVIINCAITMPLLNLPAATLYDKPVPKTAFYKHFDLNAKMKQRFVEDVAAIRWLYKLAPSTLNVDDGKQVHEIVLFLAQLKQRDCPNDIFLTIDQKMPRHVLFLLEYEGQYKMLLNYKEWKDEANGLFSIVKTFATQWLTEQQLSLTLDGQTMDALYESFAGQISGFGTTKAEDTKRMVELENLITKAKREVDSLQKKIRTEQQLNRQMEMNSQARNLKKQIEIWQNEWNELKNK